MTCAICRYYDVCVVRNTRDACTHTNPYTILGETILGKIIVF